MSNDYNSFPQENEEEIDVNIPFPSEDEANQLVSQDMKKIFEMSNCQFIDNEIMKVCENIESIDVTVLDIIGSQMEKITQMHTELIESTKRLFSALVNLKSAQHDFISAKRQQTIQLLTKIEKTINSISKIE